MEICEPENVVEDVQIKTASTSIDYAFNLDISVHVLIQKAMKSTLNFARPWPKLKLKNRFLAQNAQKFASRKEA